MNEFKPETYKILTIDDNPYILRMVSAAMKQASFQVMTASSGEVALEQISKHGLPHLAIVDITMPFGMDGFEFCRTVQAFSDLPVIMLTAIDEDKTIIKAIDRFAEDYVTKPFNPSELVARVRRVLRRIGDFAYSLKPQIVVDEYLQVNFSEKHVVIGQKVISLTPTETKLLYILMRNAGRTVTTDFILRRLWPFENVQGDRLRVYIHRLRNKIERQPRDPNYILSQRGVGYAFGEVFNL